MIVLGLDGGGTSLKATLVKDGKTLKRKTFEKGVNISAVNVLELERIVKEVKSWSGPVDEVRAAFSGAGDPQRKAILRELIEKIFPHSKNSIFSDAEGLIVCCYSGQPLTIAIAGTGSIVVGVDQNGKFIRSGGWGHLFDDEGSAFSIVKNIIIEALLYFDGLSGFDPVFNSLLEHFGYDELPQLANLQRLSDFKEKIASFAKAMPDTELVRRIMKKEIKLLVDRVKQVLGATNADKVYGFGGMFNNAEYRRIFLSLLKDVEFEILKIDVDEALAKKKELIELK
ncbi:BadF/BadG/BcrA/BcrD ATPase family protein [Pseudothermotoga sp.]|nr:ATPase [Pseudothermotoga sp.]MDW8139703.1 BadF/BadG/BcrA/BcrD ATPase family protein [Pseudothermotoga sp.]